MTWPMLWGKYGDGASGYHPLLCHLLDVLAVAELMWRDILSSRTRTWVARDLRVDEDAAGRWVAALAGLHDLGKASPAFQLGTLPDPDGSHRAALERGGLRPSGAIVRQRHDLLTAHALPGLLVEDHAIPRPLASELGTMVGGHHGVFPSAPDIIATGPGSSGGPAWDNARRELADVVFRLAGVCNATPPVARSSRVTMLIAGLVSVADWIGS
ncbi:MAG: CRISPR-associated endonuclease Cas3'', partial [Chloroflexi bacterium]|nr:CRISPR-associated endonuclease Cas3'' [Chloroflexota bacterium]